MEEIETKFEKPTGEFEYFEIKRGDWRDEIGERLDTAGTLLYKSLEKQDQMREDMNQNFSTLRQDYGKISDKIDSMDQTLKELTKAILKLAEKSTR